MTRLILIAASFAICVTLTGCEEKTGSTVYHNANGTVTTVDYSKNHITGQNHIRSAGFGSEQQYQQAQNNDLGTRLLVAGAAIAIKVISDQCNEEDHSASRETER